MLWDGSGMPGKAREGKGVARSVGKAGGEVQQRPRSPNHSLSAVLGRSHSQASLNP